MKAKKKVNNSMKKTKLKLIKENESALPELDYPLLHRITERAFFMALEMIDIANHKRPTPERGEPKVGGHPSACASSQHILAAIHLVLRQPEDYFAFKPHISPLDHAYNHLLELYFDAEGNPLDENTRKVALFN
jgi:pyruvate dehydrogenase complex dehydrogenase (E1) component